MVFLAASHSSVRLQLAPPRKRAGWRMSFLLSYPFSTVAGLLADFLEFLASLELIPSFSEVFFSLARAVFS